MRKGYRMCLGILTVMILLTITVGTSYSWYTVGGQQDQPNLVATTCFKIAYEDGFAGNSSINLAKAYPGKKTAPYKFKVTNTCSTANGKTVNYMILLGRITPMETPSDPWANSLRYSLIKKDGVADELTLIPNNKYKTYIGSNLGNFDFMTEKGADVLGTVAGESVNLDETYILNLGGSLVNTLAPGANQTFDFNLWIHENADNSTMGKAYKARLLVYAYI